MCRKKINIKERMKIVKLLIIALGLFMRQCCKNMACFVDNQSIINHYAAD
jgi:hypothetical protein